MKAVITAVAALILIAFPVCYAADAPTSAVSTSGNLVFLGSPDLRSSVSLNRLNACMLHLAEEMQVADKPMPRILLLHLSKPVAEAMGVNESSVRRVLHVPRPPAEGLPQDSDTVSLSGETQANVYYELWLVGDAGNAQYAAGIQHVLETHFQLEFPQTERLRILAHVVNAMDATVSVKDLGE